MRDYVTVDGRAREQTDEREAINEHPDIDAPTESTA
jgi:hypothetical protein